MAVVSSIRQLVSQTAIYGLSSILGRFLNYLLVPLYTYTFAAGQYGVVSEFYAYAGFFAVLLVLGLETGYFRFRQQQHYDASRVYAASLSLLFVTSVLFFIVAWYHANDLADRLDYVGHPEYVLSFAGILAIDALSALPFARLRAENKAWRFAGIKLTEIFLTIALNLLFLLGLPAWQADCPLIVAYYQPDQAVAYIFYANVLASGTKLLLLLPQFRAVEFCLDFRYLLPILRYSLPMVIIGFAGMVNEMLDRVVLRQLLPYDNQTNLQLLGIYGACYKLSILMTLFVQAFRYAGEPFFFSYAGRADAKAAYALVMRYFVIAGVGIFLLVSLYIEFFKYFIGEEYRQGLAVVPILLLANLCLGVYVNLSVWYKLSDRTGLGAWVALSGAALTLVLNWLWIPEWGYLGSAWATLACYGFMVLVSWLLGRYFYPVPYSVVRIVFYVAFALGLLQLQPLVQAELGWNYWQSATGCFLSYWLVVAVLDVRPLLRRAA